MNRQSYFQECEVLRQNCEYTAEAHHFVVKSQKRILFAFQVFPAIVAALSGMLVAGQVIPAWWGWLTVISAVVTAVANVLNPLARYFEHLNAARAFTILKHEARALKDAFGPDMSDEKLAEAVKGLHDKYAELLRFVPPTEEWAFDKAREKIKSGIHKPDSDGE